MKVRNGAVPQDPLPYGGRNRAAGKAEENAMSVKLETRYADGFLRPHELNALQPQVSAAHEMLHAGTGLGNDFLGWLTLPTDYDKEEFARIQAAAARIQKDTDIFIAIGIGGSYLGARAAIEFLKSPLYNAKKKDTPDVYFAGNSISSAALNDLLALCDGQEALARACFDCLNWQSPETWMDEYEREEADENDRTDEAAGGCGVPERGNGSSLH